MRFGNKLTIALSVLVAAIVVISMIPIVDASSECVDTEGGVVGNRRGLGLAGTEGADVFGTGMITGPSSQVDTYAHAYVTDHAADFAGGSDEDEEPFSLSISGIDNGFSMQSMGKWLDGFTFDDTIRAIVDKWNASSNAGYTTSTSEVGTTLQTNTFPPCELTMIPEVNATGDDTVVVNWTGMPTSTGVIGFIVYRAVTNDTTEEGWGAEHTAWTPAYNSGDGQAVINTSQSTGGNSGVDAYIENSGEVGHTFTDNDATGYDYYALSCVYAGTEGGSDWNIESLYRGAANARWGSGGGPPPPIDYSIDIELRSTTGLQMVCIPGGTLGNASTAMNMAEDIEIETDMQVVYISDYEGNWNDFIYRDSNGNMMDAALHSFTDYPLIHGEGYVLSLRDPGGASDFTWETIWENRTNAVSIDLDAGWNNVGIPYDLLGNYDSPGDVVDGVDITSAAAWVGNGWESGVSWSDVQTQSAGDVSQTFYAAGNAHGFFVKCPSEFTWDQAQAL